ncbi:MAG: zinc ribbon domain-containing protein [Anaerolineae bacterium]
MNRLQTLLALQLADQEWDEKGRRYQALRRLLADTSELEALREACLQIKHDLSASRTKLRNSELEMASLQAKQRDVHDSLYSGRVRLPKDLETLQKESQILQQRLHTMEDETLNLMALVEEYEALDNAKSSALHAFEEQSATEHQAQTIEYNELRARLKAVQELRERLRGNINRGDLALYDELRGKKNGIVLAPMAESSCQICRVLAPVRKAQSVVTEDEVITCEGCGRILYPV